MIDPNEVSTSAQPEGALSAGTAISIQRKTRKPRKPKDAKGLTKAATPASKSPVTASEKKTRRVFSSEQRAAILRTVEAGMAKGQSVKNATAQAGVSEQTYYFWKRSGSSDAPASDLKDLLALEEENMRLKKLLAERLRKENADLRKKLGLK